MTSLAFFSLARWMNDLFQNDSIEQVALFRDMYEGYQTAAELIDSIKIKQLDLSTSSASHDNDASTIKLFPNPGNDKIHIRFDEKQPRSMRYKIVDINGRILADEKLHDGIIQLPNDLTPGLYYIFLFDQSGLISRQPYVKL